MQRKTSDQTHQNSVMEIEGEEAVHMKVMCHYFISGKALHTWAKVLTAGFCTEGGVSTDRVLTCHRHCGLHPLSGQSVQRSKSQVAPVHRTLRTPVVRALSASSAQRSKSLFAPVHRTLRTPVVRALSASREISY